MEYVTVEQVVAAYKADQITLDEAVEYIVDRWEWADHTVEMIANEEDLIDPSFSAEEVALARYSFDSFDEHRAFIDAISAAVKERIAMGEIPPWSLPR